MGGAALSPDAPPAPVHSRAFRTRRFLNWFPLGLTYATYYMGRYNFNVVKGHIGNTYGLSLVEMGFVATAGFWTYALSVIFNGPLADRFGGRKAVMIGGIGAGIMNVIIGLCFFAGWSRHILIGLALMYSVNAYFQSFGAASVVKVNASWFHVRERGVFGGVFGIMISSGYWLALKVGGVIFQNLPWWLIFVIPGIAMFVMVVVDYFVVRDQPSEAGFENFNTGDASSGEADTGEKVDFKDLAKRVFTHPVLLTIACAEFCTGFVRQGLLLYFTEFLSVVHHVKPGSYWHGIAATGITVGGIAGGLLCGWMSDKLFQSRRAPVAFIFYVGQIVTLLALGRVHSEAAAAYLIGFACMWIFGVHGMLSGTASMDFGGRKAAATAAGMLDGVQYLASGFTGFGLGWILEHQGWGAWTWSIIPFSTIGALLMLKLWNAKPQPKAQAAAPALATAGAGTEGVSGRTGTDR